MYLIDYHSHSHYSSDGEAGIEELVLAAIDKNINELAITDHVEFDYPPVDYQPSIDIDYNAYSGEIAGLAKKYENRIRVVLGIEAGLQTRAKDETDNFFIGKDFDLVIGSTHAVGYKDLYDGSFFIGKSKELSYTEYFEDIYNSIKNFDMYHVYGHLDSIVRYGPYADKSVNYEDYREIIDEILKLLIKKGKGIEVNSSGIRYGLPSPHPSIDIVKRYRELGGEIITAASDAHRVKDIGSNLDIVYEILRESGFKAVTAFHKGKPRFVDI